MQLDHQELTQKFAPFGFQPVGHLRFQDHACELDLGNMSDQDLDTIERLLNCEICGNA